MANGERPSDLDEFVLRSDVRAGLKREFVFALKAQASLPVSIGRTRSGKALVLPASPLGSKRPRKSSDGDLTPPSPAAVLPARPGSNAVAAAHVPILVDCAELKNDVAAEAPSRMGVRQVADAVLALEVVKPLKVFVRLPSRGQREALVKSPPRPINLSGFSIEAITVDDDSCAGLPNKINAADSSDMVVDSIDSICADRLLSGEKDETPASTLGDDAVVSRRTQLPMDDTSTLDDSTFVSTTQQPAVHVTPSLLGSAQPDGNGDRSENFRRFTRSLLKVDTPAEVYLTSDSDAKENCRDINKDNGRQQLEKPPRRFTRSLLKVKAEDSGSVDGSSASSESSGSEEVKCVVNADNGALSSTPKKKMELKMSKKIALTKLPTNSRELLATGLLEGLHVQYVNFNGKQTQLQGVIKGNGILCSCTSCNGSIVVSTYAFEQHAGSTKKHPADFIYLDNGKNLGDVVKACTSAPLDMLEAVIQGAVGPQPPDKSSLCQKCKGSFIASRAGNFAFLCDKCLEQKQILRTPSPKNVNVGATRSSRANTGSSDGPFKNLSTNKKASTGKLTRKDFGLHKLVFMYDILPEGTEVGYYVCGKRLLEGYIKDFGIYCLCCNTVVSPSQFESHAGQASRRKPYNNIYTSNGVSLHELSVSLSKDRKFSTSENDDLCSICADGGDLLLCDLCPRAFHKECAGLPSIPKEDWYCQYCINLHQRERSVACNDNAIAAGRVAGVDPIEQIFKRCIRMVTTEIDTDGCTLCRLRDFSKSRFDDRTVMICDQCEKEYHVGCLRDNKMADLKELPDGEWFCCADCKRIRISLQELLQGGPEQLLTKNKCESDIMNEDANVDIIWRLLSGKTEEEDIKLLLSKAVAIFHESFDPIVDAATGRDLIPSMVYGRTVRDQDYGGMYCAILSVGTSVVSAGILRVLGREVAELPLVATSREHQGKGYFQSLFSCIERLLASLKVKHFVLPAADEAESIWTKKFGFSKITSDQLEEILNGVRTTVFHGTSMLHKPVPLAMVSCQAEPTAHAEPIISCQLEPISHEDPKASSRLEPTADAELMISCQHEQTSAHEGPAVVPFHGEPTAHQGLGVSCQLQM